MRIARLIGALFFVLGIAWALEGAGALGSAATGQGKWLVVGVGVALIGFLIYHWTGFDRQTRR